MQGISSGKFIRLENPAARQAGGRESVMPEMVHRVLPENRKKFAEIEARIDIHIELPAFPVLKMQGPLVQFRAEAKLGEGQTAGAGMKFKEVGLPALQKIADLTGSDRISSQLLAKPVEQFFCLSLLEFWESVHMGRWLSGWPASSSCRALD